MSGIDWSKAPAWATRLLRNRYNTPDAWADKHSKAIWVTDFICNSDAVFNLDENAWVLIAERPSSPAWSGPQDGLPPVGLVLEYMWNYKPEGSEYVQVEILVHDKGGAIMRTLDGPEPGVLRESRGGYCGPSNGQPIFRLIRTPEQKAAEQKEADILRIWDLINISKAQAKALYEAGLRFTDTEQPK